MRQLVPTTMTMLLITVVGVEKIIEIITHKLPGPDARSSAFRMNSSRIGSGSGYILRPLLEESNSFGTRFLKSGVAVEKVRFRRKHSKFEGYEMP
jgi:hypothetical protein